MSVAIGTSRDTSAETITEKSMRLSAMSRELGDLLRNTLGRLTTQDAKPTTVNNNQVSAPAPSHPIFALQEADSALQCALDLARALQQRIG